MNPQNAQTVFESSVMNIYDMYNEKMHYDVYNTNYNASIMQFFQFSAIFQ
jgi:hypothetical protein